MSTFNPTLQQQAAIDCYDSIVITACPGSGKTTVMKEKIRGITPNLPSHKGVIAITFTKKASEELKKRCKENAHDTKLSFFGTIDSFCLKELILPFLGRVWDGTPSDCKIIKKLDSHQQLYLSRTYSSPTCDDLSSDDGFKALYDAGILWMSSFAALSLLVLNNSVSAQRYIRARYSHVFIDEYQDSSQAQHELFMKIKELGLIATAVGDIDQSIYQFRGSQPKFLLALTKDNANFQHFELDLNHRCHPSIVNYASRLLNPAYKLIAHEDDIHVFRRLITGSLKNAAEHISPWIGDWVKKSTINSASDVAILAKKEVSLREFATGLTHNHRLYTDTPLNGIGTECADVYLDLLSYKFGAIPTAQDVIEKYFSQLPEKNLVSMRKQLKTIRAEPELETFIEKCNSALDLIGLDEFEAENDAVRIIWNNDTLVKLFKPIAEDEVQLMTLHKSKGLEFKIIFHLDMEEWSFPHRVPGANWDDINYPSLAEDTNLHYVGITRAELCCVLIRTTLRKNAKGNYVDSRPSYFLGLPQLEGLYK
ncbi:ATP-dependent helicase [Vibrio parahaemolyticus]|uniref:UvrD-helicase domain-containing protein n=2 Tax=Vibrio parahaemolyticus TaxID=670 RepID=UPI00045252BE|nr:ATP-dependent helicase [Vibrio parahaemolyticus]EJG0871493.1 ATP-dependent helicase [Vibrio parahaemolyticus O3]EJG0900152.1 ATP-dependent helicase [Vibrio parahaemolyticus O3:K56]EJG1073479.1 ATP-dependent helicase [Vibrio parahaemolyticus O1:K56]EGR1974761.1 ATP-dependent helicase [Vibrio parahaemolyticus]EGR5850891.1 ATP-dependent helicase [Vibrio parahaemolyticus]